MDQIPIDSDLKSQAMTALRAICSGANDTREQYQDFDTIKEALKNCPPGELTQKGLDSLKSLKYNEGERERHIEDIYHALKQLADT
jgi:hypothetical protein